MNEKNILEVNDGNEIVLRNTYLNLRIPMAEIITAMRILKRKTGAGSITTAIELMFFTALPEEEMESVSLLITLIRCIKDGSAAPPLDIDKLYATIALPP